MTLQTPDIAAGKGSHAVHFYEHDAELVERVGAFLVTALAQGAVAIAIATEPHRRAFESELETAGIDPADALRSGRLVSLDAATTLTKFMPNGRIDAEAFRGVVGDVVRDAARTGRPVRAYGEMVALLWDAGYVLGAIELEELWNDLGRDLRFSLLCGYPSGAVSRPEHAEALRQVCELHSAVVHAREVSGRFAPELRAPHAARHLVSNAVREWGYDETMIANAELVCTELATNAVVHARTPFSVVARPKGSGVRISVHDASPAPPALRDGSPAASSGRGLRLVALLGRTWGVESTRDGKSVWAELQDGGPPDPPPVRPARRADRELRNAKGRPANRSPS
jgi:anti-sigma regulatory factor (Ser/Thr protein kinase)